MTDQSPALLTEQSSDRHSQGVTSMLITTPKNPRKPWLLYFLILLLGLCTFFSNWKLFRLERRTQLLEVKSNKLSTRLSAALSSLPSATPTALNSLSPIPLSQTQEASLPLIPLSAPALPSATTTSSSSLPLISNSLPGWNSNTAPSPLPEWVYRSFVTATATFLQEGNWEAATKMLAKIQYDLPSSASQSELLMLRQAMESQKSILKLTSQQLQQLETWVYTLPLKKIAPPPLILQADSRQKDIWSKIHNELIQDISLLVRIEPSDAEMISIRNAAAFESKNQLISALRNYHNAWRKNDLIEQNRTKTYIQTLLAYGFDEQSETVIAFQNNLDSWFHQPNPVKPPLPSFIDEGAL